ncbi:MAG: hypothetical protein IK130_09845 [Oscillospiraceae bacterium]|nr:hypothetical protein [Oscillospiraceae bacterium]
MGNILYGDLGSEHMVYTDKNSVSYIVQSLYSDARDMMAGYYCAERESCGIWYYVHKYNSRRGGYLTATAEELTGKLSPAAKIGSLQFATKEEFERQQHLGSMNLDTVDYPMNRNTVLQLLERLFAAMHDQKTLYLVLSKENCSERDYMLRGLSVCRKILSVLPEEYQKRLSFVSNTMPGEKSGLRFSVMVMPRKYQDIYMTEYYRPFDEPVFDLSAQMPEPENVTPLTAYYADLICGRQGSKQAAELLERVTPGKDLNMRIYENIYSLYYYGQKAQIAENPEKFWQYWRVIANKKAARTYGPLNNILKRLPKSALELLRKKQEEEVQKKQQIEQHRAEAEKAVTDAETLLHALYDQLWQVQDAMNRAVRRRQNAIDAPNAEEASQHLECAVTDAEDARTLYAKIPPMMETVSAAEETARGESALHARVQAVVSQAKQYDTFAKQYIAEAERSVEEIGKVIVHKKNRVRADEALDRARTDLSRAGAIYAETIMPALRLAYDALNEAQQLSKADLADRKLFVMRKLREEIADHAEVICEYVQSAVNHITDAVDLDPTAENIPSLKQSADNMCVDARQAVQSIAEAENQLFVLRDQARTMDTQETQQAEAVQTAVNIDAQPLPEPSADTAEIPAETAEQPEAQPAEQPVPVHPALNPLNLFQTNPQLSPEFQRLLHGGSPASAAKPLVSVEELLHSPEAKVIAEANQPETSAEPEPAAAEVSEPEEKPAPKKQPAAVSADPAQKDTLPDLPFTRTELDELLGEVSQLMFTSNKRAIEEQQARPRKRRLGNLRAARKAGVMGLRLYPYEDDFKTEIFGKDKMEYDVQSGFWGKLYERHPDQNDVRIRGQYDSAEEARFFGTRDYIVTALNSWLRDKRLATVQVCRRKGAAQNLFCRTDAEEAFYCWLIALLVFYRHEPSIAKLTAVQDCFDSGVVKGFFRTENRAKLCCFFALLHIGCMLQANMLLDPQNNRALDSGRAETAKRYLEELGLKDTLEIDLFEKILKNTLKRSDYGIIREELLQTLLD